MTLYKLRITWNYFYSFQKYLIYYYLLLIWNIGQTGVIALLQLVSLGKINEWFNTQRSYWVNGHCNVAFKSNKLRMYILISTQRFFAMDGFGFWIWGCKRNLNCIFVYRAAFMTYSCNGNLKNFVLSKWMR